MISTRDLSGLPHVDALKRLMQSIALLDAILSPDWEYRWYSFNSKWATGEQMGSMRNGNGDDLFALFTTDGCFLKGFWHESKMSPYRTDPKSVWPGVLDSVPAVFNRGLHQAAFSMADTTFCVWRQYSDRSWQVGKIKFPEVQPRYPGAPIDPDGSEWLLSPYDGKPETYLQYAKDYRSRSKALTLDHVRHVYEQRPLSAKFLKEINPELTLAELKADIAEIGYPQRASKKK
jgi:hypothetical protein